MFQRVVYKPTARHRKALALRKVEMRHVVLVAGTLIDVGSGLGRGLEKCTAPPLSKMLALLSGHLLLMWQVHLVGDQHCVDENIYELSSDGQGEASITLYMSLSTDCASDSLTS